jgi:hypothetical protein
MNAALAATVCAILSLQGEPPAKQPAGEAQEERAPTAPMPMPRNVIRHLGTRKIVVDGDLSDWPEVPPFLLTDSRQLSGTAAGAWRGEQDLSAIAFMAWDGTDLYVAAKVKDDWHRPLATAAAELPPADAVVLTFDLARDTRAIGPDPGRGEDREFWLAQVEGEGKEQVVQWDRLRGSARFAAGARVDVSHDQARGVTTYEARLPWMEVLGAGRKPEVGLVFDVQVVVDDFDEPTDTMPQTRVGWTFGTGVGVDPGLLGTVMLVGDVPSGEVAMPDFPPPAAPASDPVPPQEHWIRLHERLRAAPPVVQRDGLGDPRAAMGAERYAVLEELDRHAAAFPRVDLLGYQQRISRRMRREAMGMTASGLPFFWHYEQAEVRRELDRPPPERGFRLYRLGQRGWLVRSKAATFAIDPAGFGMEQLFWNQLDFALLTSPRDFTTRNDQLLLRMLHTKRPVFTHLAFHLPTIDAMDIPLAEPGKAHPRGELEVTPLALRREDGTVGVGAGYRVRWPDGVELLVSGRFLDQETLDAARAGTARPPDALILSAAHGGAAALGQRVAAGLTVLDDVLQGEVLPVAGSRVKLEDALDLQAALVPRPSLLLAPGESVLVAGGE